MSDGNTAIPVSPVAELEPEMKLVFDMFSRASNAIVNASELAKTVSRMENDTSHLREALGALEEAKRSLEERLYEMTSDRDDWSTKAQSRADTIIGHEDHIRKLETEREKLLSDLVKLTEERNGWEADCHTWEQSYHKTASDLFDAEAKLAKMRSTMQAVFGEVAEVAQPVKAPEPYTPPPYEGDYSNASHEAEPVLNPPQDWHDPIPLAGYKPTKLDREQGYWNGEKWIEGEEVTPESYRND